MVGAASDDNLAAARPGTVLGGKYRVERELARGGMGVVVVATHLKLERLVAIKLIGTAGKDRAYVTARFEREARAAGRLTGDHVARIIDLDETPDGTCYLVMELLEGTDLERLLQRDGPVAPGRAVDWALQACAALAEAHARGIVHRDVKPANLFLVSGVAGALERVKLLDFGISKILSDEVQLTRTASTLGSPLFMSPEQLLTPGVVDVRSDVWSLGVTLYRLLAGKAPFDAADASGLAAQIAARPPTPLRELAPGVPETLAEVVMRCLEKEPAARWPTIVALADALEPFRAADALGRAASVRQAEAAARAAEVARPPPASPAGSLTRSHDVPAATPASPAGRWTLSHDVPAATPASPVGRWTRSHDVPAPAPASPAGNRTRSHDAAGAPDSPAGNRTRSHDVPAAARAWAPAAVDPGPGPAFASGSHDEQPPPSRRVAPRALLAAGVVSTVALIAAVLVAQGGSDAAQSTPPAVASPAPTPAPSPPPAQEPAVAAPTTPPPEPASPARDAGVGVRARPVRPASGTARDPSDLELK